MAEDVVDVLEAVEIDAQHREFLIRLRATIERHRQMFVESRAIGQVGKRIVIRQMRDTCFRVLLLGDVLDHQQHVLRIAVCAHHRHAPGEMGALAAMRRVEHMFAERLRHP